jgi:hypothetical protein
MTFATSQIPENLREQIVQATWLLACAEDGFPPEEEIDRLFPPLFSKCQNCGQQGICRKVKSYDASDDGEVCEECFTFLRKAFRAALDDDEELFAECEILFHAQTVSSDATHWN